MPDRINHRLWSNYAKFAEQRGWLITQILSDHIDLTGSAVADLGCGRGGTAVALATAGALVTAIDFNENSTEQLARHAERDCLNITVLNADLYIWQPLRKYKAIVLWDVLEHVEDPGKLLHKCRQALSEDGIICLATPNKWSPLHWLADPHYSLPLLAIARRSLVKKVIVNLLHLFGNDKRDVAQLVSLRQLSSWLADSGLHGTHISRRVLELALLRPESVWNRPWHLFIVRLAAQSWLRNWAFAVLRRENHSFAKYLVPTFYMIIQKNERAAA